MRLLYRLRFFLILLFFVSLTSYSQIAQGQKLNNQKHVAKKLGILNNPKDIELLSEFIDTLLLSRFYSEIEKFEQNDSLNKTRIVDIVFVGSSSIRKWNSLESDMLGLNVVNRGFGGSTVPEAIFYSNVLFLKHKPDKIVFYSGDNDVATLKTSSETIMKSYIYLHKLLSYKLPETKIYILSIKPSPGRWQFWTQMKEINNHLKVFCNENENCEFIDVSSVLIDSNGNLQEELFKKDRIHLNENGYRIWTDIIYPVIK